MWVRSSLRLSHLLGAAGAAFLGARAANRNTKVVDERAKKTAEWERIDRYGHDGVFRRIPPRRTSASITFRQSKADWNSDPEQRAFIKRTLEAINAPAIQAYRGGQTTVVTPHVAPPPPPTAGRSVMSETLYVTPAQVLAAKLALELSEEAGEVPDEALKAIANAQVDAVEQSAADSEGSRGGRAYRPGRSRDAGCSLVQRDGTRASTIWSHKL